MRMLELFCGTKSIGKVAESMGWEVVSVDIIGKFEPTHVCDIREWDYTAEYPAGHFDVIWASPPCTEFSKIKRVAMRDTAGATALVRRARDIIDYFAPRYYCVENPVGDLRKQPVMEDLASVRKTVSYCKYGFMYRKDTDLWTNIPFTPRRCLKATGLCETKARTGKHSVTVQGSHYKDGKPFSVGTTDKKKRYAIPPALAEDVLRACE